MSGKGAKAFADRLLTMAPLEPSQQRQESLSHAVGAEQVDGEVPFEHGPIAQVVVERHAGVIDEDVERVDFIDGSLDLRSVGHVQGQGCDAPIPVGQGLARAGIYPFRTSVQRFLDQGLSDAAIGPGDQNCLVCDGHTSSWLVNSELSKM